MESSESRSEQRAQVSRALGRRLRRDARRRWDGVRTAERSERGHQVWRFRPGAGAGERFLHVANEAMEQAEDAGRALFRQLRAGRWLDRLDEGGETSLRLTAAGRIEPYTSGQ
jgi:hypothetical protein